MPYTVFVQIALSYSINLVTAQCRKPGRRLCAKLQTDELPCRVAVPERTRVGASQRLAKFEVRVNNVFLVRLEVAARTPGEFANLR